MNCVLIVSLQSFTSAALPLKIPQPAHLTTKLSAICQVWLCRALEAHRALPVAIQPLCQPAAWRAGEFNKPDPLIASHEKKDLFYQTDVLLVSPKPSCWQNLTFMTTLRICHRVIGGFRANRGVSTHKYHLRCSQQNTTGISCFPLCSHTAHPCC